jgi:hypothetical protein
MMMVQALGVDWGQGYFFSLPLPPDEIPELLRRPPVEVPRTSLPIGSRALRVHREPVLGVAGGRG